MCLCPKWLQCTVSHITANAWPCALRKAAAAGWKHNTLCHPWCALQVCRCSGTRRMSQLLMAKRAPLGGPLTAVSQLCWTGTSPALGTLHPFLLPGVPSCLKPWSCRLSARTPFRLAYLTGWDHCHPFCFLACALSCSVLGSFAGCSWLPFTGLGKNCPSQQPHAA